MRISDSLSDVKRGGGSPFSRPFLRDAALASLSQRGKRQIKNIRAADTQTKTRLAAKPLRLAANLGHAIAVNVGLCRPSPTYRADDPLPDTRYVPYRKRLAAVDF